jgi:glycosyltransferase involved in cell wall biosynthesis
VSRRPAIVIVTEKHLFPVSEGNRARIVTLVRSLRALGFFVVLVARRPSGLVAALQTRWLADRFLSVETERFSRGSPSAYDCTPFYGPLEAAVDRFAPVAVIAEYIWMAPCLDVVGNGALRLIDTHDLMHRRRQFLGRLSNIWVDCSKEEERLLLEKADVVIAIQPRELERFRELVPSRDVICIPHYVPVRRRPARADHAAVVIVASDNPGNLEGLTAFLDLSWPIILKLQPSAELRIFGTLADKAPAGPNIVSIGYVRSLRRAYRDAAVVINPVRFGTGLKIKNVEALAGGNALVTTSCGAEGLESGAGVAFVVEDDMERFGLAVAALLADGNARTRLGAAAAAFAEEQLSRERIYGSFLKLVASRRTDPGGALLAAAVRR